MASGTAAAGGGATGLSSGIGTGETVIGTGNATFLSLANFISIVGVSTNSGSASPIDITPLTSQITTPGGYGGSYPATNIGADNGGSIISSSISPLIAGGLGTTVVGATAGNGADGITSFKPFFSTGGAGGGSSVNLSLSGFGGNGGKGGIGSGGGAGGCGASGAGIGGNGGDGIVIVVAF